MVKKKVTFKIGNDVVGCDTFNINDKADENGYYGYLKNEKAGMFETNTSYPVEMENNEFVVYISR